jgi:WD40 repeat protein
VASPDGQTVAAYDLDHSRLQLWDVATGRLKSVFAGQVAEVYEARFSPDGRTLVTRGAGVNLLLWDVASGKQRAVLQAPTASALGCFSPDSRTLVADTDEDDLGLYDLDTGIRHARLAGFNDALFAPDSRTVVASADSDRVGIWDATTGMERAELPWNPVNSRLLGFSPDAQTFIIATHNVDPPRLEFWDVATASLRRTVEFPGCFDFSSCSGFAPIRAMAPDENSAMLSADGRIMVVARPDIPSPSGLSGWLLSWLRTSWDTVYDAPYRRVSVWDVVSGHPLGQFRLARDFSQFSPDGRFVAAFGIQGSKRRLPPSSGAGEVSSPEDDCTVEIWDVPPGRSTASYLSWAGVLSLLAILLAGRRWSARQRPRIPAVSTFDPSTILPKQHGPSCPGEREVGVPGE